MRISQPNNHKEYRQRQRNVMNQMAPNSIAFIAAASEKKRSKDTYHRFRQSSDFYYMTGFIEADALLILIPGREEAEVILFCQDKNPDSELWNGYRYGPEEANKHFAVDDAFPIDTANEIIPGLIENYSRIYFNMNSRKLVTNINQWLDQLRESKSNEYILSQDVSDLNHIIHELRLIKSQSEIKIMQKAANISANAHIRAMKQCKNLLFEYQLQAEMEHEFLINNCEPAYSTIVGSGDNGCVLHYITNSNELVDGDLILIDAGAEYSGYAADITRTFPVSGLFSPEQKQIYEIVLEAQLAAINACQIGESFITPHTISVEIIVRGLLALGIIIGEYAQLIETKAYYQFYPHRVGHWVGLDVHDVGEYKVAGKDSNFREFEAGMVTTIEPGIYIQPDDISVNKKWRGIGIRIEDEVLITNSGPVVLSKKVPKQIDEIEKLMD